MARHFVGSRAIDDDAVWRFGIEHMLRKLVHVGRATVRVIFLPSIQIDRSVTEQHLAATSDGNSAQFNLEFVLERPRVVPSFDEATSYQRGQVQRDRR